MAFNPKCLATGIGSMPDKDPSTACDVILENIPEIPFWPQLPNVNFREGMEIQYCEGLPCVTFDEERQRMYFETSGDITGELEKFYENYVADNLDHFKITPEFSHGIFEMEKKLTGYPSSFNYFKTQVTGPITIGLGRVDENKRAIYYNEVFRDVIVKGTEMKARWLVREFNFLECKQICFIDEPILSAFGSSTYVSVQRSDIVKYLNDVIKAIHKEGALTGIHCCGNTEWPILIDAGVDIISFDAYEYGETIGYYPEQINTFLEKGGALAWGIVINSEQIFQETPDSLTKKLEEQVHNLARKGIDQNLIWERCLITPSCGTGSRSIEVSNETFLKLSKVRKLLRN